MTEMNTKAMFKLSYGLFVLTAKVGDKISIPKVTVTDNLSTDLEVKVFVFNPDNGLRTLLTEDKFTVTVVGKYEISFMCIDDAGNLAFESFYINVTSDGAEG